MYIYIGYSAVLLCIMKNKCVYLYNEVSSDSRGLLINQRAGHARLGPHVPQVCMEPLLIHHLSRPLCRQTMTLHRTLDTHIAANKAFLKFLANGITSSRSIQARQASTQLCCTFTPLHASSQRHTLCSMSLEMVRYTEDY